MVRKIVVVMALLLLSFEVLGQEYLLRTKYDTVTTKSERLYLDTAFDFDFDNTEYSGSNLGVSETLFGISLMPVLRFEWNENHNLGFGVNMQKLFGSTHFLDKIDLVAYYQFHNEKYGAVAGLFRRDKLMGRYSEAFFCNAWLANNRVVQGLALQYHDKVGYAELVADWNGLYSTATREQFRILFSGEGRFARYMYAGASVAMHHYANRADFQHNVVDNFTINPYLGVDFSMVVNVEARLGYLQTLQRDRLTGGGFQMPMGGEFFFKVSYLGIFLSNNIYVGKNLQPLYNSVGKEGTIYGTDLYASDSFYGTTTGIYNRTGIGYERNFWKERIKVKAEMVLKTDGKRLYNQQIISLGVNLAPKLYDKANKKK